jgi:predicted nuclease of predicted toxin-antitoxin system
MRKIKFLADVNVEKQIVDFLKERRMDIKWVAEINKQMSNGELMRLSKREKRILITNDKDFGEIVFLQRRLTAGIILFRIKSQDTNKKVKMLKTLLEVYFKKIKNHFVVITEDKIRFIPLGVAK